MRVAGEVSRPRAYLASPLGFSEPGRHWYRTVLLPALAPVVEVLDPWTLVSDAEAAAARAEGGEVAFLRLVGARNAGAIDSADLVVAVLDGQEVDAGVAAEVGYAAGRGVRCVGLRTDLRQTGEDGAIVNLQVQWFLERDGGSIAGSVEELLTLLALRGPPGP